MHRVRIVLTQISSIEPAGTVMSSPRKSETGRDQGARGSRHYGTTINRSRPPSQRVHHGAPIVPRIRVSTENQREKPASRGAAAIAKSVRFHHFSRAIMDQFTGNNPAFNGNKKYRFGKYREIICQHFGNRAPEQYSNCCIDKQDKIC
jgi:hypothetical protein